MKARFQETLSTALQGLGLGLDDAQLALMYRHVELLQAANERINLTRIKDPVEAAVRHCADSLVVLAWLEQRGIVPQRILDVGTGGGFPALPLAIARPEWQVTAIDGTGKKINCVQGFVDALGLANCQTLHQRVEHWTEPPSFDVIVLRAVSALAANLQQVQAIAQAGSVIVSYKTDPLSDEERAAASRPAIARAFEHLADWPYTLKVDEVVLKRQLCCYRRK